MAVNALEAAAGLRRTVKAVGVVVPGGPGAVAGRSVVDERWGTWPYQ
jgi:hypothetical protein